MSLLTSREWRVAESIASIGYTNPFLPKRIELEKRALGKAFVSFHPFLQYHPDCAVSDMFPNAPALRQRGGQLLEKMREKLLAHESATDRELEIYEDLALYQLYARHMSTIVVLPVAHFRNLPEDGILNCYDAFSKDHQRFFELPERKLPSNLERDFIFAGLYQVERAFFHIFRHVVGASLPAAQLRAAIWQSIFTHDMRRYHRALHQYMGDIPTLITGPSGTGKELVAQAIAYSRFVEFDSKSRRFATSYTNSLVSLNLSAIAPTLIEAELFGHAKGAFTGADTERQGYLDDSKCPEAGSVFLDEIGELDTQIQVKLLRVLQSREYQRVGDSKMRKFVGKIIAATNRDLAAEMAAGRFREDFYYRLCADRIETPSLCAQLQDSSEDITNFVRFLATRLLPQLPEEADRLTEEVVGWVDQNLGADYPWPGNIRELEQCVRSIMIRRHYVPAGCHVRVEQPMVAKLLADIESGELSQKELLTRYFSLVYARSGSYRAAARRLGIGWRTVKEHADDDLVRQFSGNGPE